MRVHHMIQPSGITNVPSPMGKPYADYHGAWFDVSFVGLNELIQRFGTANLAVRQQMIEAVRDVSKMGVSFAQVTLNKRRKRYDTGQLADSIKVLPVTVGGDSIKGGYGTSLFYAFFVERGRGWVFPIRAKMLSWIDRNTGERVFARSSRPMAARPFMEPSSRQLKPYATQRFNKACAAIVALLRG